MDLQEMAVHLGGKALNNSSFIGSLWGASFGALATAITSENAVVTAICVAASGILGALFSKIPDIIKARTDSKKAEEDVQAKLIQQIYQAQDRERAMHEAQVNRLEAEAQVIRQTKHEMLNEIHALTYWIYELRELCATNHIKYPEHTLRNMAELMRAEDKEMKLIQKTHEV